MFTVYRYELSVMSGVSVQADDRTRHRGTTELPVRRLDAVLDSDNRPGLLKMDVEGLERQLLHSRMRGKQCFAAAMS